MMGLWSKKRGSKGKPPQPSAQASHLSYPASASAGQVGSFTGTGVTHNHTHPAPSSTIAEKSEAPAGSACDAQPPKSLSGNTSLGSDSTGFASAISGGDHPESPAIAYTSAATTGSHSNEQRVRVQEARDPEQHSQYRTNWRGDLRLRSPARAANSPVNDQGVKRKGGHQNMPPAGLSGASMYLRPVGRRIEGYELLDTLGWGYSGKVKRGRRVSTGELVALKIMERKADSPRACKDMERLTKEIRNMGKCRGHPNTVNLIDARLGVRYPKKDGTYKEVNLLVMELCENGELFDLISMDNAVTPLLCKQYFHQLMLGLHYLHGHEICHRDLKPENLLLDKNFALKIADFGFSTSQSGSDLCKSVVGSKTYMAPEVLERRSYNGTLVDVWSAGVILFTMLVGHPPMELAHNSDWWFRSLQYNRQDLFWQSHERGREAFPEDAKGLINRMLAPDPQNRIQVAEILHHPYLDQMREATLELRSWQAINEEVSLRMSRLHASTLASKRPCYTSPAESSRGTLSSRTSGSNSRSPVSAQSRSQVPGHAAADSTGSVPYLAGISPAYAEPSAGALEATEYGVGQGYHRQWHSSMYDTFGNSTCRSSISDSRESMAVEWEQDCVAPIMTRAEADSTAGAFMARGRAKTVMEALEKVLQGMGAKFPDPKGKGLVAMRSSFKILAEIPPNKEAGGQGVTMMLRIYRRAPSDDAVLMLEAASAEEDDEDDVVVVIRRRGGTHQHYSKMERSLRNRFPKLSD